MTLFEDMQRVDGLPPTHNDGSFTYLSRSDRPEAQRVRDLIEEWLDHYPADKRDALVSRLRLADDDAHLSAYLELLLHEWMLRRGFVILAIEPPLPGKTTSPDFLVETGNGDRFYLEAVTATGRSKNETGARKRLNDALATIDSVSSPHHFLDVHHRGSPRCPKAIWRRKLRNFSTKNTG
jgi:hypothetical protein